MAKKVEGAKEIHQNSGNRVIFGFSVKTSWVLLSSLLLSA